MLRVECPACKSSYELGGRGVPSGGMRMRCPSCAAAFRVHPDGSVHPVESVAPGATLQGLAAPGEASPASAPRDPEIRRASAVKKTIVGIVAPAVAPSAQPAPRAQRAYAPPPPTRDADVSVTADAAGIDVDLPDGDASHDAREQETVVAPRPTDATTVRREPPERGTASPGDLDLPAPRRVPTKRAATPAESDSTLDGLDLPVPRAPSAGRPAPPPLPSARRDGGATGAAVADPGADRNRPTTRARDAGDVDLPAPRLSSADRADLPAPRGTRLDELDLPAPRTGSGVIPDAGGTRDGPAAAPDLPLPAPRGATLGDLDLPAPRAAALGDLDLPAPRSALAGDLDLPAPRGPALGDLDLPAPRTAPGRHLDLPAPRGPALGDLDLPAPRHVSADAPRERGASSAELDLPAPSRGSVDLPAPSRGALDLPAPAVGALDLPGPSRGILDLPSAAPGGLPAVLGGAIVGAAGPAAPNLSPLPDDLELPPPRTSREPPDVPRAFSERPPEPERISTSGFGELQLPEPRPQPPSSAAATDLRTRDGRGGVGGVQFGEIDLGGPSDEAEGEVGLPEGGPRLDAAIRIPAPARVEPARHGPSATSAATRAPAATPRPGRGLLVGTAAFLGVLVAGGAALGLTQHGVFGVYALERLLPEAGDPASAQAIIEEVERIAAADTYATAREALERLGTALRDRGLDRRLLARAAVHEALFQIRFGPHADSRARLVAILGRLEERSWNAPGASLARAADALLRGNDPSRWLAQARAEGPDDPYVDLVAGEAALAAGRPDDAEAAFRKAAEHGAGARAHYGVVRARLSGSEPATATEAIEATLAASPGHVGARIARARLAAERGDIAVAVESLRQAAGLDAVGEHPQPLRGSPSERVEALTWLGRLYERRGERVRARDAYEAAIAIDAFHVEALVGAGRVMLEEQRPREALSRFEAVLGADVDPERVEPGGRRPLLAEARLGAARALWMLERPQEARTHLEQLVASRPEDAQAVLWLGRTLERLNDRTGAEQSYRDAIRHDATLFEAYVALAQLFMDAERFQEAAAVLTQARARVPESAAVRRQLGEAELRRNQLDAAAAELRRALELDPDDVRARFLLGVVHRRAGRLAEAAATLDAVAERDPTHPGLALERGLVFEAQGRSEAAVGEYERALRERPGDVDLLLRLGAAQVSAGLLDAAERTLGRVLAERPTSAEAAHFVGRVAFARGDLPEAIAHFERSTALDGTRGEFHLYVAWAALESGQIGRAMEAVEAALARDPSQGDAYWIRGRIRLRTGAVRDALSDLQRALALKPARHEAHASIAECHDQLRNLPAAIESYRRALAADATVGEWWYRLGRLQLDAGRSRDAMGSLARAIALGEARTPPPAWLAEAFRLAGDAQRMGGSRQAAIQHYRRYLELAPPTAVDREDVEEQIRALGG
ncbi:MAG: tetratricopeptide repeat protein [Myxococcota bacterium]|nr:tetratricopeptide repeat protein [Myxococcota bacterium]